MSDLRTDAYAAGYYIDPSTRQTKVGTYNASEFARQLQAQAGRPAQVGTHILSQQELRQFASRYDPNNMTQKEYSAFIDQLVQKGVLSTEETYDIGLARTTLRPGCFVQGGTAPERQTIRTLSDARGDALYLVNALFRQCAAEARTDKITAPALRKIGNVLQEMKSCRSSL